MKSKRIAAIFGMFVVALGTHAVLAQSTAGRGGGGGTSGGVTAAAPAGETTAPAPVARTGRSGAMNRNAVLLPPTPDDGPTCAFDATIYSLKLPADQIGHVDVDELNKAAGKTDDFEKALLKIGKFKPLYRIVQSVMLQGDSITIGSQTPFVTNTNRSSGGRGRGVTSGGVTGGGEAVQNINTLSYSDIGAIFDIAGAASDKKSINLKMKIQLTVIADSNTNISDDLKAQLFRASTLVQNGPIEPNKPFVIMSMDASSTDSDGAATAFIARVNLGEPKK
jgi:hypothetical protein